MSTKPRHEAVPRLVSQPSLHPPFSGGTVSDRTPFAQKGDDHISLIVFSSSCVLWERLQNSVCSFEGRSKQLERLPGFVTTILREFWPISPYSGETVGRGATGSNPRNHLLNTAATPED